MPPKFILANTLNAHNHAPSAITAGTRRTYRRCCLHRPSDCPRESIPLPARYRFTPTNGSLRPPGQDTLLTHRFTYGYDSTKRGDCQEKTKILSAHKGPKTPERRPAHPPGGVLSGQFRQNRPCGAHSPQYLRSRLRSWMASAMCRDRTTSLWSRSAMVRATRTRRSYPRADRPSLV